MRDLRLQLDDGLHFDELVSLGRSLIPALAPAWTDHNVHDPGIMLMELMAWIADTQIYSLARRPRRDERAAYANLMGLAPTGPLAASGLIWPDPKVVTDPSQPIGWARGTVVGVDRNVRPDLPDAPVFHPTRAIYLTTCRLTGVYADGSAQNLARINARGGTTYLPFGNSPTAGSQLRLVFTGGSASLPASTGSPAYLSIGVQVPEPVPASIPSVSPIAPEVVACNHSALRAILEDSSGEHDLSIVSDSTCMLTKSGVLILAVDPASMAIDDAFSLILNCPSGAWLSVPRVSQILPNVLPVEQREKLGWTDVATAKGLPDEMLQMPRAGAQFGAGAPPFLIRVNESGAWHDWTLQSSFDDAKPADRIAVADFNANTLIFGNGVNGMRLPPGGQVQAAYHVSAGSGGNLPAGLSWSVQGIVGVYGRNVAPHSGGRDPTTPLNLQVQARARLRTARPIVSVDDLQDAAMSFVDLGVTRALELPLPSAPFRLPGQRRLVVVGAHTTDTTDPALFEPPHWLDAIRGRLLPRLQLGQSLEVIAPRYVSLRVSATITALPRISVDVLLKTAGEVLTRRFAIVRVQGLSASTPLWPFGHPVSETAISGWLRKVEGVARVQQVTLTSPDVSVSKGIAQLTRLGLPLYQLVPGDLRILRGSAGART